MTPIQDRTEPGNKVLTKRFKAQRRESAWIGMQKRALAGASERERRKSPHTLRELHSLPPEEAGVTKLNGV
ncbi:hypothetical protein AVE30378_05079 [Achromobacter veterisilvae]|uniref:Uncharacterized protein n=2 Tax=Achromobacter veterisilvae TaxID=2069367 RepID=A0A446CWW0_9BURK|nr:hypothetical protein AVE30378_05079 [Achromobacter veterisilvae]